MVRLRHGFAAAVCVVACFLFAGCTNGTTPDCADAACGYTPPPLIGVPVDAGSPG